MERALGNRQGQRTDKALPQDFAEVSGRETRDLAAERAGFGNRETYRQAKEVVERAAPELVEALDAGKVSVSAAVTAGRKAIHLELHQETGHGGDHRSDQVANLATCSFVDATAEATGRSERAACRDVELGAKISDQAPAR